ncbi:DNA helicase IV [Vibrio sagamiensis]|uniref:DNA 3'-5' helicase n=1 Tax=Vibrio sagamiensis NBRC 104589 TaxID=1219064 RepID=A0A511QER6_9VIBR|nr:DNA helicase IV [Vibrio sagamiensis]PNQ54279.1 DNA helicase IV [Vibrio agarivorans]GEM75780.1 DNA helicase [Vibrio sagamiensis NBRC 104589]
MQLSASTKARFFIQNEYYQVKVSDNSVLLSSNGSDERIPFTVWSGKVVVRRGLLWSSLQFFAHQQEGKQQSWLVQGLPWQQCREFAARAVKQYQDWHNQQCSKLLEYLPRWEKSLSELKHLPIYLSTSKVDAWIEQTKADFCQIQTSLLEAKMHLPNRIKEIDTWLTNTEQAINERNLNWLSSEREKWASLFDKIESSPLNFSQQQAVLLNNDHNLILAGAGSGKTSVLTARVAYLLQSEQAHSEELLMLAFGRDAASEMQSRLKEKVGTITEKVSVNTFHQLGLHILNQVESQNVEISPLAIDENQRTAWCIDWLKKHWMTPANFKRWQKHLDKWPIAYLKGDDELGSHSENPKLIAWLDTQITKLAASGLNKKQVQQKLLNHQENTRLNSELTLCWPCFTAWQKMLKESKQIDFPTMISRATDYVMKGKFISPWRFIMIDEYQDISPDRLALIEALCTSTDKQSGATLFAVGDDWQAIYQFAGAEVDLTTEFQSRFRYSTVHQLDTTYRFNDKIGIVANTFVQENPRQIPKVLSSHKQRKQKSVYIAPSNQVEKILDQLNHQAKKVRTVLLLGRNHYHKPELYDEWLSQFSQLNIQFMTCHASKGKEADFVIILSVNEGQFPAKKKHQHIDSALTGTSDHFPYAEERRLFYVALTRAKERVWITHTGSGSSFVHELSDGNYPVVISKSL